MSKIWYAASLETADVPSSGTGIKQIIKPNINISLLSVRTWILKNGTPTLTNLKMKIYTSDPGTSSIAQLKATSTNSYNLADISASSYAAREIYFTFSEVSLHSATSYYLCLVADSYSASDSNHIAWVKAMDPIYTTNAATEAVNIPERPFLLHLIGAEIPS